MNIQNFPLVKYWVVEAHLDFCFLLIPIRDHCSWFLSVSYMSYCVSINHLQFFSLMFAFSLPSLCSWQPTIESSWPFMDYGL